jgi:ParB family transcriptional regulator, chromosome partitioning protein
MGTKDTRAAHGAAGKKDMLLFDPEELFLVTDESSDLYDERVRAEPTEALIANIAHYGVIEPVIVRKNTESGQTEVVDGRQRVLACRAANKLLKKRGEEPHRVPAIVKRGDAGTAIGIMISTNEQRREDTPLNRARKAARMLERGKTEDEVALALGVTGATLKNLLKLLDAPAAVRNAVDAGKISLSDGYKLSRLEPGDAKEKVAALLEHAPRPAGAGRKKTKNAKRAREILGTRPTKADLYEGMRTSEPCENLKRELEELGDAGLDLHRGAILALRWVLGDDSSGEELAATRSERAAS